MSISKILRAKQAMTPKPGGGFNLVGVDTFESEPGDELYLIANYATEEEAQAALVARKTKHPDEIVYIYGPDTV